MNTKKIDFIVYKATKWELFLSKHLPYWLPFISKRKRVRIKWYYKYQFKRRAAEALTKALMNLPPPKWDTYKIEPLEYEWEIVRND